MLAAPSVVNVVQSPPKREIRKRREMRRVVRVFGEIFAHAASGGVISSSLRQTPISFVLTTSSISRASVVIVFGQRSSGVLEPFYLPK